jgi:hypothetical protein
LERELIVNTIRNATAVFEGYRGRKIAQGPLDARRVLRVVYEEGDDDILVITFYPGRRERYEQDQV